MHYKGLSGRAIIEDTRLRDEYCNINVERLATSNDQGRNTIG